MTRAQIAEILRGFADEIDPDADGLEDEEIGYQDGKMLNLLNDIREQMPDVTA